MVRYFEKINDAVKPDNNNNRMTTAVPPVGLLLAHHKAGTNVLRLRGETTASTLGWDFRYGKSDEHPDLIRRSDEGIWSWVGPSKTIWLDCWGCRRRRDLFNNSKN